MNESTYANIGEDFGDVAGVGFTELKADELREGPAQSLLSSGFICTATAECNC